MSDEKERASEVVSPFGSSAPPNEPRGTASASGLAKLLRNRSNTMAGPSVSGAAMPPTRIICVAMLAALGGLYMVMNANSLSINHHHSASGRGGGGGGGAGGAGSHPRVKESRLESATKDIREKERVIAALRDELRSKAAEVRRGNYYAED